MIQDFEKIRNSDLDPKYLQEILEKIKNTKINVLLIGSTGAGKSSTVNALFSTNGSTQPQAKVGESANPATMGINSYELKNMVIWDTPGLGDSTEKDQQHQKKIIDLLKSKDAEDNPLIDLIFLVLDGGSRDFNSAYTLIKEVVAPQLHDGDKNRLLIGINKVDKVMHHKFWDEEHNQPKQELLNKLEEQSEIVKQRIEADTGFRPDVIYYAAGETHEGQLLQPPYNLLKLLSFIIERLPKKKRASIANDLNKNKENFQSNDNKENYREKIEKSFLESIKEIAADVLKKISRFTFEIIDNPKIKDAIIDLASTGLKYFFQKNK